VPGLGSHLLDGVLNCPPLSCAATEDKVDASQAPVLHLQAAPCTLIHDGSVLEREGVTRRRQTDREDRGLATTVLGTELLMVGRTFFAQYKGL
jgi:hypothetical protein